MFLEWGNGISLIATVATVACAFFAIFGVTNLHNWLFCQRLGGALLEGL